MAEINARIDYSERLSNAQANAFNNPNVFTVNEYQLSRPADFYVYLYNVSEIPHDGITCQKISRPPILAGLTIPSVKSKINKTKENPEGVENDKPWILAARFPSPINIPYPNCDSDEIKYSTMDGRRYVMDLINPDNLGIDQDAIISKVSSLKNNLGAKGVFWSTSYPPKEEEVDRAIARMEKYYRKLLEEIRAIESSSPAILHESVTPEHHFAADHFSEVFPAWHNKRQSPVECPQCHERTFKGAGFHTMSNGATCVTNWDAAISAGVKSRAQAFDATDDPKYAPREPKQSPKPSAPSGIATE